MTLSSKERYMRQKPGHQTELPYIQVTAALSAARNMLADGLSHEKIAQYTGLPLKEVEELAAAR